MPSAPRHRLPLLLLLLGLAVATSARAVTPGWRSLDLPGTGSYAHVYVPVSLPSAPGAAVVFLHGSGSSPEAWRPHLAPLAEELGLVVIAPRAAANLNFGIGADEVVIERAVTAAAGIVPFDARRVGLAGHSAGGAFALVLAYAAPPAAYNGVFAFSAPYRSVVRLANPWRPPPIHFWYGTADPNYVNGHYQALHAMFDRLGVPNGVQLGPGLGHNDIPPASLRAGFAFLAAQPVPLCAPAPTALCLRGRFRVEASWQAAGGQVPASALQLSSDSGTFSFGLPASELLVRVVDSCARNQRYWVLAGGATTAGVVLTVSDLLRGGQVSYTRPRGKAFAPVRDVGAFATCP